MKDYVLRIRHSVENTQGYDPREWTTEEAFESFEEALAYMADALRLSYAECTTEVSFVVVYGGCLTLIRTGGLCPQLYVEACDRIDIRRSLELTSSIGDTEGIVDDDDLPF